MLSQKVLSILAKSIMNGNYKTSSLVCVAFFELGKYMWKLSLIRDTHLLHPQKNCFVWIKGGSRAEIPSGLESRD